MISVLIAASLTLGGFCPKPAHDAGMYTALTAVQRGADSGVSIGAKRSEARQTCRALRRAFGLHYRVRPFVRGCRTMLIVAGPDELWRELVAATR